MDRLRELFENLLYPELAAYGRKDRDRLLQEASKEPHDFLEWVGILRTRCGLQKRQHCVRIDQAIRQPGAW